MDDLTRTVFSLALLGESEVGKTSLIMRLCNNEFNEHELSTVGKESHMYPVKLHGHDMKIKIFDTAGQERFRSLIVKTFKIAEAIMLVYSIGNKRSFNQLDEWLRELSDKCKKDYTCEFRIIYANQFLRNNLFKQLTFNNLKLISVLCVYVCVVSLITLLLV